MRLALILAFAVAIVGCGSTKSSPSPNGDDTPQETAGMSGNGADSGNTGIFAGCGMFSGSVQPEESDNTCIEVYGPLNANFAGINSQDHCSTDSIACYCMYKWGSGNCDYQAEYGSSCSVALTHQNQIGMCTTFVNNVQ